MHDFRERNSIFELQKAPKTAQAGKLPPHVVADAPELQCSSLHQMYVKTCDSKKQRLLVKLLTDRFSSSQLEKRGFDILPGCRRGCSAPDTLDHFIGAHIFPELPTSLPKGLKRQLNSAMRNETLLRADIGVVALASSKFRPSDNLTPQKKRRRIALPLSRHPRRPRAPVTPSPLAM